MTIFSRAAAKNFSPKYCLLSWLPSAAFSDSSPSWYHGDDGNHSWLEFDGAKDWPVTSNLMFKTLTKTIPSYTHGAEGWWILWRTGEISGLLVRGLIMSMV